MALLAVVDLPSSSQSVDFSLDTLILENIQDPGNVGWHIHLPAGQRYCKLFVPKVLVAPLVTTYYALAWVHTSHFNTYENAAIEDVLERF